MTIDNMALFTTSREFCDVVRALRKMHEQYRHMALFAATFWSDKRLEQAERNGDVPGRDRGLPHGNYLRITR
jgi:hypothetical protein